MFLNTTQFGEHKNVLGGHCSRILPRGFGSVEVFARAIEGSYPDFSVFSTANKSLLAYIVF